MARVPALFIIIILLFLLPTACSEKLSEDVVTYPLDEESKVWLYEGAEGDSIVLTDSTGNMQVFTFDSEHSYFLEKTSGSGPFGWVKEIFAIVETQSQYWSYSSGPYDYLSVELTAGMNNEEDLMSIEFLDTYISFYPENMELDRVTVYHQEEENMRTGRGLIGADIKSGLEYYDSINIGGELYYDVMQFALKDLYSFRSNHTVVAFTYGQGTGLISYRLESGIEYIRKKP